MIDWVWLYFCSPLSAEVLKLQKKIQALEFTHKEADGVTHNYDLSKVPIPSLLNVLYQQYRYLM